MKAAVVVFPGSNCDRDVAVALRAASGSAPVMVWHKETALPEGLDLVVLPGGFTYGDYLRCGAIAAHARVMAAVRRFAERGGHVLGICNGFQILTETGLLPGALIRNAHMRFVCRDVHVRIDRTDTPFTTGYTAGQVLRIPVAHHDGNYVADADTLARLSDGNRVVMRYVDPHGAPTTVANPNGSVDNIAGVCSADGRVVGMMPHPERLADARLGGTDGAALFQALAAA